MRYCLEHCGHSLHHSMGGTCARRCYDAACSSGSGSTFAHLKRNSSSIYNDSEDEDYASEEGVSEESIEEEMRQPNSNSRLLVGYFAVLFSAAVNLFIACSFFFFLWYNIC